MTKIVNELPKKADDGDQVMDRYGNIYEYNAEEKEWIFKGQIADPDIVNEKTDGLVSPAIYNRLTNIRNLMSSGVSFNRTKLYTSSGNPYFYYFHSVDKLLKFIPEIDVSGNKFLRIEVDKNRFVNKLIKFTCSGPMGAKGLQGPKGRTGTPYTNEIFLDPIEITDKAFEIDCTVPIPINTPISIRLYQNEEEKIEIKYDRNSTEKIVEVITVSGYEVSLKETSFNYEESSEVLTGKIILSLGSFSTGVWQYKARQVGPTGSPGVDGEPFLEVKKTYTEDGIRFGEALISLRKSNVKDNLVMYKSKLFESVPVGNVSLPIIPTRIKKIEDTTLTAIESSPSSDACTQSTAGYRSIGIHKFVPTEYSVLLDLPQWTPTKKCDDKKRYDLGKFDWFSKTKPTIPIDFKLDPAPPERKCAEDFYYCPNLGDACGVGGELPQQVGPNPNIMSSSDTETSGSTGTSGSSESSLSLPSSLSSETSMSSLSSESSLSLPSSLSSETSMSSLSSELSSITSESSKSTATTETSEEVCISCIPYGPALIGDTFIPCIDVGGFCLPPVGSCNTHTSDCIDCHAFDDGINFTCCAVGAGCCGHIGGVVYNVDDSAVAQTCSGEPPNCEGTLECATYESLISCCSFP